MVDVFESLGLERPKVPFRRETEKLYETETEICWTEYLVHPSGRSRAVIRDWIERKAVT